MALAVTHVLIPIIAVDFFRDHILKDPKAIPNKYIFVAGVAGLVSDLDMPFSWLMHFLAGTSPYAFHKTITHSIWMLLPFIALALIFYKKEKIFKYSAMISVGVSFQLLLDGITRSIPLFWGISASKYGLNLTSSFSFGASVLAGIDAVILLLWLWHEERYHNISNYL